MYDFKKGNFTFLKDFAHDGITNPVAANISADGQIIVGYDAGSSLDFYQFYITPQSIANVKFETKELNFGVPNVIKRLYSVYIRYKSDISLSSLVRYSADGGSTWVAFSSGSSATSTTVWQKGKWSLTTPKESSTFMIQLDTSSSAAQVYINDISFEYRRMHKRDFA